jgi:predicted phosphodiesterase
LDAASISPPELSTLERLNKESDVRMETMNLVVVSDTHGFEGQLIHPETKNDILPDGDVLLHLGDFALDGSHEHALHGLKAFDIWLAKQPHKYKIVVRGNHDPWTFNFSLSKAWYVTKPATINVGGFVLAVVPHGSPRKLASDGGIPKTCDILATHIPPYKTLDRSYSGKHAGSPFLTKVVRGMRDKAPRLWLCGHIHEARGVAKRNFGGSETTVINAANANAGRASHLEHGPVVVQLEADKTKNVEILEMADKTIDKIHSNHDFFEKSSKEEEVNELLLAVDLGLKSGVSLFNSQGALVRYEQFYFQKDTLQRDAGKLIEQWQVDLNDEMTETDDHDDKPYKVTHIAIEGADGYMLRAWAAAAPNQSILRVSPDEWRSDLLLAKEKTSGATSKAAARLIARQVVEDFGMMERHSGKFPTDVAEAVVIGLYVARKLGWIHREPAVRRYTNGNIVLPRKGQ